MAHRRGMGPSVSVPVPAALQPYFSVNHFNVPLHGKGRSLKKGKHHHPGLHGNGRGMARKPSPWKGGAPSGK